MAALAHNPELLLRAFLETAKDLFADPTVWLKELRNQALAGNQVEIDSVLTNLQDFGATAINHEGSSTNWMRELTGAVIAQLAQASLDVLASEKAATDQGLTAPGSVRHADFSQYPCTLG